ncbi:phosphatidate cytidylyltransferase [Orrella daihaiensis]|uniref:Phosphatidate cytidylyltransferase n=1 Tax=Orrella daihaiensis TaxID=2782176 RepID=A0ABY4AMU9_9BURK|nr:phosphatidate cytidylyltransferase [Orrella daihaiensis]UOD49369.1 phosphatidate cytidylyltransferase [Orrella daihaiensis]
MLLKRVVTAVVLLGILAVDLSLENPWPLLVFFSLVVGVTAYEWLRLTAPQSTWLAVILGVVLTVVTGVQAYQWLAGDGDQLDILHATVVVSVLVWLTAIPWKLLTAQINNNPQSIAWSLFAPVCLFATWGVLALLWINSGAWSLLSLLLLIWIADILAYFGGKQFGKQKLAPHISPGKTREGALFGLAGVVLWMLVTASIDNSYASWLLQLWGWVGLIAASVLLGVLAVMGDLFESFLKRQANVKDSSRLLPGHGGVYDRVDAVVAVVPVAYFLVSDFWYS